MEVKNDIGVNKLKATKAKSYTNLPMVPKVVFGADSFDQLGDILMAKHHIQLPTSICSNLSDCDFNTMISVAMSMHSLWENALVSNWRATIAPEKLRSIYEKI